MAAELNTCMSLKWALPSSNHLMIIHLRSLIIAANITPTLGPDRIRWGLLHKVSLASLNQSLRTTNIPVAWHRVLWHSFHVPRFSFITWLAIRNRLNTMDRLLLFGLNVDSQCRLCGQMPESITHLFFDCAYSAAVYNNLPLPALLGWADIIQFCGTLQEASVKGNISCLFLTTAVYYIWQERNGRAHDAPHRSTAILTCSIRRAVQNRLHGLRKLQQLIVKDPTIVTWLY